MQGRSNLTMVFISTNELLLTSKASMVALFSRTQPKVQFPRDTGRNIEDTLANFSLCNLTRKALGRRMNEQENHCRGWKWGRAANEGQSSFSCASNSTLEPAPTLTTATRCCHAVPPSVPWLQVSGATCTWYTFKPRTAYRVWRGRLSKCPHLYEDYIYLLHGVTGKLTSSIWRWIFILNWHMYPHMMEINPSE